MDHVKYMYMLEDYKGFLVHLIFETEKEAQKYLDDNQDLKHCEIMPVSLMK